MRLSPFAWLGMTAIMLGTGVANAQPGPQHGQGNRGGDQQHGQPGGRGGDGRVGDGRGMPGRGGEVRGVPGGRGGEIRREEARDIRRDDRRIEERRFEERRAPAYYYYRTPGYRFEGYRVEAERERLLRRHAQYDLYNQNVLVSLRGRPMDEPFRIEMRRHAERIARLERIGFLAQGANDEGTVVRVRVLLDRENSRHDVFISSWR